MEGTTAMLQQKIIDIIEEFAPLGTQAEYDKCGLKTGQTDVDTTGVLVCLDLNNDIVKEAVKKNCNLIIEHHPSIWKSWKEIDPRYPKVRALLEAYSKNITVYSAHTNIDFAFGGLNDFFASQIGLEKIESLKEGRIGVLKKEMTVRSYADFIKETLSEKYVKIIGDDQKLIKNVACINGAGGGDEALDLDLMKKHLIQLKQGKEIYSPLYDFVTCESKKNEVLKKPAKLILNEGLYVLNENVRDITDVKIYVYTPFEVIKERWFARATSRGKTGLAAQMQFHDVNQTAFRHIRPSMDIADVVINGMTTQQYIEDFINKLIEAITSVLNEKSTSL